MVKDVSLDTMSSSLEVPLQWPMEFEKKQQEIVELWHACNVSLVHRTYFFLLFKGDPTDSIYMEVELRRLSFLKNTYSQGNLDKTADGSQISTILLRYHRALVLHFPSFRNCLNLLVVSFA